MKLKKIKLNTYTLINSIIIAIITEMYIIPMTYLDRMSYLLHDGRWWLNQYYEYYSTFPQNTAVAFNGFNNSGLAINMFYPNFILKIIETPLIILHVQNPYIVMGILNIITISLTFIVLYAIIKQFDIKKPLLATLFVLSIQIMPLNGELTNSIPQQLAVAFLYLGVYAIISKKYEYMIFSTILLVFTSFATCMIAILVYAFVLIIQRESFINWIFVGLHGLIGLLATYPLLFNIFSNLSKVSQPTNNFAGLNAPWTIITYILTDRINTAEALVIRSLGPLIILVIAYLTYTKFSHKLIPYTLAFISIISLSPKISGVLTTPIQAGTWTRIWPIVVVCAMYFLKNIDMQKHYKAITTGTFIIMTIFIMSLNIFNFNDLKETNYVHAIKTKNWSEAYRYSNINLDLTFKNNAVMLRSKPTVVASISPDYIPAKATLNENAIAYTTPQKWLSKYGLEKHTINNGKTLKITINPKRKVTPLGVWHYDFIKYNIKTTNGYVNVSKHDMFEYHGTQKATIYISLK